MFKQIPPPRWLSHAVIIGISCLAVAACKKAPEQFMPASDASKYVVTVAQASMAAANIALSADIAAQRRHNQQTGDTQRVFEGRQRVLSLTPVPAADGQPGMYLCNYAQGGFAIIAADRHMPPILAFAEHGALPTNLDDTKAIAGGLLTWLDNTNRIAAALRQNPAPRNAMPSAAAAWVALVDSPASTFPATALAAKPAGGTAHRPVPDEPPREPGSLQVGPLIQAAWGQGVPYNAECRFDNVLCQTGCIATSMAQIMRYWQYPARYNWAAMPYTITTGNFPELAQLMHNVGDSVDMSYGRDESSANTYDIPAGFRSFGYGSADYHDYPNGSSGSNIVFYLHGNGTSSWPDVMDNFRYSKPIIFGGFTDQGTYGNNKWGKGSGHNWVGDGFIENFDENGAITALQFHMNWGWDNHLYNGWFTFSNWAVYTSGGSLYKNYQYCQDVVVDIHP